MRRLPPLAAVRAFEAAARNESFTAAAAELGAHAVYDKADRRAGDVLDEFVARLATQTPCGRGT